MPEGQPSDQIVSRLRDLGKGAGRTALLWAAALAIVWLSGLESTRKDLSTRFADLAVNHRDLQRLDHLVATNLSGQIGFQQLQIENADQKLADTSLSSERRTELKAFREGVERSRAAAITRQQRYSDLQKHLEQERTQRTAALRQVRQSRRQVSFNILGQSFEVPPFYAPVVWNAFLVGLLLYLADRRRTMLALAAEALAKAAGTSALPAEILPALRAELPWWLAPLPGPLTASAQERRVADLAIVSSLLLAGLAQARVSWAGLDMSRWIATGRERALLTLVLLALLGTTAGIAGRWFRPRRSPAVKFLWMPWSLALALFLLAAAAILISDSRPDYRVAQRVAESFALLSLLLGLATVVFALGGREAESDHRAVQGLTRRQVVRAALCAVTAGLFGMQLMRRPAARRNPRFVRRKPPSPPPLAAGFYLNPRNGLIHRVSASGRGPCDRSLHSPRLVRLDLSGRGVDDLLAQTPAPRLHAVCAASFFEEVALAPLQRRRTRREGKIRDADFQHAFSRLTWALHSGEQGLRGPNYRLYDLLAVLAMRKNRDDLFAELKTAICTRYANSMSLEPPTDRPPPRPSPCDSSAELSTAGWPLPFRRRAEQWNRIDSSWNRRVRSDRPLHWGSHDQGVVF